MEISVNVKLDASDKLLDGITRIADAITVVCEYCKEKKETEAKAVVKAVTAPSQARAEAPSKEQVVAELKSAVETAKELDQQPEITEADIREAMQRVRDRIEVQEDKEERNKYHRNLTSQFKLIAEEIAECKPSQLPTQENRRRFIERIGELEIFDGEITEKAPF